jgi:hypothetical protein
MQPEADTKVQAITNIREATASIQWHGMWGTHKIQRIRYGKEKALTKSDKSPLTNWEYTT